MTQPLSFPLRIPFADHLGLELWRFEDGEAELRLAFGDVHRNAWSVAHGGVLMTLLDVAMAHAARSAGSHDPATVAGIATIEMKTSFMRPAEGELRAFGKLLHRTRTLSFCEGRLLDGEGHLCAHATGTFRVLRATTPHSSPP